MPLPISFISRFISPSSSYTVTATKHLSSSLKSLHLAATPPATIHPFPSFNSSILLLFSTSVSVDDKCRSNSLQNAESKHSAIAEFLLQECGLSQSELLTVFRRRASLLRTKSTQTAQQAVKLFRDCGFSEGQVRKIIVRNPSAIAMKVDGQLKVKIKLMETLGLTKEDFGSVISSEPRILTSSLEKTLYPNIAYLQCVFGSKANLSKALKRTPGLLLCNIEKRLEPILNHLRRSGIQGELLTFLISRRSAILTRNNLLSLKKKLEYVKNMGISEGSKTFIYAIIAVDCNGPEILERKLKHMASLGLLEHEVMELLKKSPDLLNSSMDKIQKNMDFLIYSARLPAKIVLSYPRLLKYSLEMRIKRRHKVFECIVAMQPSKHRLSLPSMLNISEGNFLKKFVKCSPQASILVEIYNGKTSTAKFGDLEIVKGPLRKA
eukprot:Gb_39322 [translate_table: standard]